MDSSVGKPFFAWQPLTPRGVASFAYATLGRLLVVESVFALLAAAVIVWFLHVAWFPTIGRAISQLPSVGEIRSGRLDWQGDSPASLAEGGFLALTVDLKHEGKARSPADVQVEFGQADYKVFSLLGFVAGAYPRGWVVAFNRQDLVPWWGAWSPALLGIAAGLVVTGLMLIWAVLATLYALPVWLLGFFANRDLNMRGSWCLAGAALMPGALLLSAAIFMYGSGAFGLVELAAAGAAHLFIGWVYLIVGPLRLPPHPATAGVEANPFTVPLRPQPPTPAESKEAKLAPPQPKE
jgi:hypothetical protein